MLLFACKVRMKMRMMIRQIALGILTLLLILGLAFAVAPSTHGLTYIPTSKYVVVADNTDGGYDGGDQTYGGYDGGDQTNGGYDGGDQAQAQAQQQDAH
jgi:hypothetical protein